MQFWSASQPASQSVSQSVSQSMLLFQEQAHNTEIDRETEDTDRDC